MRPMNLDQCYWLAKVFGLDVLIEVGWILYRLSYKFSTVLI